MIEVEFKQRNGIWEAYVNNSLFTCGEDLEAVLKYLAKHLKEIKIG
jgi:hypothetical protein